MLGRLTVKLVLWLLNNSNLSIEDRGLLTTTVLDRLAALPLRDMIVVNEDGSLFVNGRRLTQESKARLRESARTALNNEAFKFIKDQVLFSAVAIGVHKLENERQSFFSRAAIWFGQQEDKYLHVLAGLVNDERESTPQ